MSIKRELERPVTRAAGIWRVSPGPDALYSPGGMRMAEAPGAAHCPWAELWRSNNGLTWEKVGVISDEKRATETALAF